MLHIKVRAALDGTFLDLLHAITVFRVDSGEHQIESGICFPTETQNSASFFRPNEFAAGDLPSERTRMAQLLSLFEVLPPSLQVSLRCSQIVIRRSDCGALRDCERGVLDVLAHVRSLVRSFEHGKDSTRESLGAREVSTRNM